MKTLYLILSLLLFILHPLYGQTKTDETRQTVDKVTGDTTVTEITTISHSTDITPRNSMIVINPLKFFLFYNITYFQKISPKVSFGCGIQMPTIKDLNGFGVNAEIRYYPSGKTLRGFYIAPNVSYNHLSSDDATTSPVSIGGLIGWQWFPGEEFAIGLGIGIDYYSGKISEDNGDFEKYSGKVPVVRFDIGYAW
jgi:hypothetical protein